MCSCSGKAFGKLCELKRCQNGNWEIPNDGVAIELAIFDICHECEGDENEQSEVSRLRVLEWQPEQCGKREHGGHWLREHGIYDIAEPRPVPKDVNVRRGKRPLHQR